MFVIRPINRTSTWAMNPATIAIRIDSADSQATRASTGRSMGTWAASSVGPSEGATGRAPSIEEPVLWCSGLSFRIPSSSCGYGALLGGAGFDLLGRTGVVFEEHRGAFAGRAQRVGQRPQAVRQALAPFRRQLADSVDDALLRDRRRGPVQRPAPGGQRPHLAAPLIGGRLPGHQAPPPQAADPPPAAAQEG